MFEHFVIDTIIIIIIIIIITITIMGSKATVVPVVAGALGTVTFRQKGNVKHLGVHT